MKTIEENIELLKKSPLFAMSLGSKELFHSNFWGWIIEQNKDFTKAFFGENFDADLFKKVVREDKNRDLVIYDKKDNCYVIENKIKAYPSYDQLVKYTGETKNFVSGVITGILEPSFKPPEPWRFISFNKVGEYLRDHIDDFSNEHKNLIASYTEMVFAICEIIAESLNENPTLLSYNVKHLDDLENIRIADVFKKNKAEDFVSKCKDIGFQEGVQNEFKNKIVKFWIERSFNNCKATISFGFWIYEKDEKGKDKWKRGIGVQIEEYQLRVFICDSEKSISDIEKYGLDIGWFEKLNKDKKLIRNHSTKMSGDKCKYGEHFVYQYFDIFSDENDFREYSCLKRIIKEEIDNAYKLIKDNKF